MVSVQGQDRETAAECSDRQTGRQAEKDVVGPAAIYLVPPWFLEYLNHVPCIQVPVVVRCFLRVYDVLRVW